MTVATQHGTELTKGQIYLRDNEFYPKFVALFDKTENPHLDIPTVDDMTYKTLERLHRSKAFHKVAANFPELVCDNLKNQNPNGVKYIDKLISLAKIPGALELVAYTANTSFAPLGEILINNAIIFANAAGPAACKAIVELKICPNGLLVPNPSRDKKIENLKKFADTPKAVEVLSLVKGEGTTRTKEDIAFGVDERDIKNRAELISFSTEHPEAVDALKKLNFGQKDNTRIENIFFHTASKNNLVELAKHPDLIDAVVKLDLSRDMAIWKDGPHKDKWQILENLIEGSPEGTAGRTIDRCLHHEMMFYAVMEEKLKPADFHGNDKEFKEATKSFYKTCNANVKSSSYFLKQLGKNREIFTD